LCGESSSLLVHVIQWEVANEGKMWSVGCRCSTASCALRRMNNLGLSFNLGLPSEEWTILCLIFCIIIRKLPLSVMTDELQSDHLPVLCPSWRIYMYMATAYHTSLCLVASFISRVEVKPITICCHFVLRTNCSMPGFGCYK
jgi:hypothetical protein